MLPVIILGNTKGLLLSYFSNKDGAPPMYGAFLRSSG